MKPVHRSHIAIVISSFAIASSIWFARFMLVQAEAETLKPSGVTHQENLFNSATGDIDGSLSYDFTDGGDRTTYSVMYLNDDGASSDVLFYGFPTPSIVTDSYILATIFDFKAGKGDDGFLIEYSTSGSTNCSDASSRDWETLGDSMQEKGKILLRTELVDVDPGQVCVRVSGLVNGEYDSGGYNFRDSNGLGIYDIWIDSADAQVQTSIITDAKAFAVDERFVYHLQVSNLGTGPAESVIVTFPLPEEVEYVSAIPSRGIYNPVTGTWDIGALDFGASASIDVTVDLQTGRAGDRVQATASVRYQDPSEGEEESYATSSVVTVSETPSGILLNQSSDEMMATIDDESRLKTRICDFQCDKSSFFLSIVNPDGTVRDTRSEYAKVLEIEPRYFFISFEDNGADFDYNDIAFELDVRDCHDVRVTETKLNGGWHHEVKADVLYDGEVRESIVIWPDSHEGIGQTQTYNLEERLVSCD